MNPYVISEEQLKAATGYTSTARLRRHLDDMGVKYHTARHGRIWTTYQQLNASLNSTEETIGKEIEFE